MTCPACKNGCSCGEKCACNKESCGCCPSPTGQACANCNAAGGCTCPEGCQCPMGCTCCADRSAKVAAESGGTSAH
ncbi:hypothetical protein Ndes2526B_g08663 [Nannochloris sp. 'desiccata']